MTLSGHIDGMGGKKTKVPEGEFWRNFTAICVVMLSDLPEPYMGNFTVWPGSQPLFGIVISNKWARPIIRGPSQTERRIAPRTGADHWKGGRCGTGASPDGSRCWPQSVAAYPVCSDLPV